MTPTQTKALKTLIALWSHDSVVLVGAGAIGCHLDMRWRQTADLDISLAIDVDAYPAGLDAQPGWRQHPRREHEWRSPDGVRIDILPIGERALRTGHLEWPASGQSMQTTGYRHVFATTATVDLGDAVLLRVADLQTLAFLKMVSYVDNPTRRHDLADWAYIVDEFIDDADERRFSDEVFDAELLYEAVSPFLLGRTLAAMLDASERAIAAEFLARARGTNETVAVRDELEHSGPVSWRESEQALDTRLSAFSRGLEID